MAAKTKIRAIDLFCGAGGSSCGARKAGVEVVAGFDLSPLATATFLRNFPGAKVYTGDLRSLRPTNLRADLGKIDLILASPECTHHSVAKGTAPRDEASKQLAFEVIRFAKALQPRWIVVENVIQMARWPAFSQWTSDLEELGYNTEVDVLDAARFGVAQKRRRLFVVADREAIPRLPAHRKRKTVPAATILSDMDETGTPWKFTPVDNGRRAEATLRRAERAISALGETETFLMVYYGSDGAGGWQTLDRPLRTVTTLDRFALVQRNCVGHEMRMLQPQELARAMGFPKSYCWAETSRRDKIRLIGNAVCPPVMTKVVSVLTQSRTQATQPVTVSTKPAKRRISRSPTA